MRGATARDGIVALTLAAAIAAGCGDEDKPATSLPAAPITPNVKPTATDLKIVRLVQRTGGRLHLDAIRLIGDRGVLDDEAALRTVAGARLKIATQLERDATAANTKLEPLGEKATAAVQLAASGRAAFDELAGCGRQAAAFFRKARSGTAGALSGPEAACKSARLAYGQAKTLSDALKAPASSRKTDAGAPGER